MKQTKEIEIEKSANGLTYILSGELVVDFYISPIKEINSADQSWEVDRYVSTPWITVIDDNSNEIIWDNIPNPSQLKFFEDEINDIEI